MCHGRLLLLLTKTEMENLGVLTSSELAFEVVTGKVLLLLFLMLKWAFLFWQLSNLLSASQHAMSRLSTVFVLLKRRCGSESWSWPLSRHQLWAQAQVLAESRSAVCKANVLGLNPLVTLRSREVWWLSSISEKVFKKNDVSLLSD